MTAMSRVVDEIATGQKPVLGLDTCDFLDVIRGVVADGVHQARAFREAVIDLRDGPDRFQPVVTYLVRHEWLQNLATVRSAVGVHVKRVDEQAQELAELFEIAKLPGAYPVPIRSAFPIADRLAALAEELMDRAIVIEKDVECVDRALGRVMDHRRPSHKNQIKDSIHWEHHLELSRRLATAGHGQDRIFVSANKSDFWANKIISSLHPDLIDEANAAGLRFFGRLGDALRVLGV